MLQYRKLQELGMSQNMGMSEEAILKEVMIYGNNCRAKRICHPTSGHEINGYLITTFESNF